MCEKKLPENMNRATARIPLQFPCFLLLICRNCLQAYVSKFGQSQHRGISNWIQMNHNGTSAPLLVPTSPRPFSLLLERKWVHPQAREKLSSQMVTSSWVTTSLEILSFPVCL